MMEKKPFEVKLTEEEALQMDEEMMWMTISNLKREAAAKHAEAPQDNDKRRNDEAEKDIEHDGK